MAIKKFYKLLIYYFGVIFAIAFISFSGDSDISNTPRNRGSKSHYVVQDAQPNSTLITRFQNGFNIASTFVSGRNKDIAINNDSTLFQSADNQTPGKIRIIK